MNTTHEYIDIIASALANKTGVKLVSGKKWAANVKNKTLEYNRDDLINLPFYISKGLLLHEIGHINYTVECNPSDIEKKYPQAMHNIYNCLEDKRIENKTVSELQDYAKNTLDNLNAYFTQYNLAAHKNEFKDQPRLIQFMHLVSMYRESLNNSLVRDIIGYDANSFFSTYTSCEDNTNVFCDDVKKRFLDNKENINSIAHHTSHTDSLKSLKYIVDTELYPIIKDYIEEFKENNENKNPIASFNQNKTDKSKEIKKDYRSISVTDSFKPLLSDKPEENEAKCLLYPYTQTLTNKLKNILEYRKTIKYTGNFNSGKLISKNIFKIATDDNKIFSKKYNPDLPDKYNIHIALDGSGSMQGGQNVFNAVLGGYLIKFVTENLKLKPFYYVFSDTYNTQQIDDPNKYEVMNGGTTDIKVLQLIKENIKKTDGDNIAFIITDGQLFKNDEREILFNELTRLKCQIIGVGIGDGINEIALQKSFKDYVYCKDVNALPIELAGILRRLIKN